MIRRAEVKDVEGINKLLFQVHKVHSDGRPDFFIPGQKKYTDEELIDVIKNNETPVFIYLDDSGNILGHAFCIYEISEGNHSVYPRKTLYIDDICVDGNARRQGIASKLYDYVIGFAKANDFDAVTLNVWALNPGAQAFYESRGMNVLKTMMEQRLK